MNLQEKSVLLCEGRTCVLRINHRSREEREQSATTVGTSSECWGYNPVSRVLDQMYKAMASIIRTKKD